VSTEVDFPKAVGDIIVWNVVLLPEESVENFDEHALKFVLNALGISLTEDNLR